MKRKTSMLIICATLILSADKTLLAQKDEDPIKEPYRPQIHFTPGAHWMNDPNGLVYYNGVYHLFFQHYPGASNWGPMHWGHAISRDLIHWKREPIALYPDSLGYIFSGSAVVDKENTSGFGVGGKVPLVAIFTHHDTARERARRVDVESQSIAYSLDEGKTWTKYGGNPVIKNPGVRDFRDPNVMWYAPTRRWILTLAAQDRIIFYSSSDLKAWTKESEFGVGLGSHGGVWECPDLFALPVRAGGLSSGGRDSVWVLSVSIGWGGPNGGNGTQYFTGKFDGHVFIPDDKEIKWVDHGRDDYAGVTWSNTGNRRIFIGWMANGEYAGSVPTEVWRSGNTLPRELGIDKVNGRYFLVTKPVKELGILEEGWKGFKDSVRIQAPFELRLETGVVGSFKVVLSNDAGERVVIGFDKEWYVDRRGAGREDFHKGFAGRHTAPRISQSKTLSLALVVDVASLELFADGGLTVMSELVFPSKPYNKIEVVGEDGVVMRTLRVTKLKGIW
ncbi:MAG: glycoside hydrolase family 32 protein [Chitinophagaceae bacterium]|nr:glycoside hydrolase family 32 protein [Chitinophagaceae bacterium]